MEHISITQYNQQSTIHILLYINTQSHKQVNTNTFQLHKKQKKKQKTKTKTKKQTNKNTQTK